jgi:CDP-diacylglycerol--serine O-phosphatidyltransferase
MLKQLPNFITTLNLLCGCMGAIFAISGDLVAAAFFVFLGIFFDFFDGMAARLLRAESPIGREFDSLADVITCGLVPGLVMVQLFQISLFGEMRSFLDLVSVQPWKTYWREYLPFVGLVISVGAAYRLAKFNVDTRQSMGFIGLPTPANALLILSLPLIFEYQYSPFLEEWIFNPYVLLGLTIFSAFIMNAEVSIMAFKFKTWSVKDNAERYLFAIFAVVALILFKFLALPLIIICYILLSLVWKH